MSILNHYQKLEEFPKKNVLQLKNKIFLKWFQKN